MFVEDWPGKKSCVEPFEASISRAAPVLSPGGERLSSAKPYFEQNSAMMAFNPLYTWNNKLLTASLPYSPQ